MVSNAGRISRYHKFSVGAIEEALHKSPDAEKMVFESGKILAGKLARNLPFRKRSKARGINSAIAALVRAHSQFAIAAIERSLRMRNAASSNGPSESQIRARSQASRESVEARDVAAKRLALKLIFERNFTPDQSGRNFSHVIDGVEAHGELVNSPKIREMVGEQVRKRLRL